MQYLTLLLYFSINNGLENVTHIGGHEFISETSVWIRSSDLSLNKDYILYYKHVIRLLILGIIPLGLLAYWNYIIYKYMKSTPEVLRQCSNAHARVGEEKELAKVLIGIVVTFVCCHIIRIILNFYDAMVWKDVLKHGCKPTEVDILFPLWVVILENISHVMLSINSSVNIIIYCCLNAKFRKKISNLQTYFCFKRISVSQSCQSINELRGKLRFHQNGENMGYPSEKPLFTNDGRQEHRQLSPQLYDEAMKLTDFHL